MLEHGAHFGHVTVALGTSVFVVIVPSICIVVALGTLECPSVNVMLLNPRLTRAAFKMNHHPRCGLELSRATETCLLARLVDLSMLHNPVSWTIRVSTELLAP